MPFPFGQDQIGNLTPQNPYTPPQIEGGFTANNVTPGQSAFGSTAGGYAQYWGGKPVSPTANPRGMRYQDWQKMSRLEQAQFASKGGDVFGMPQQPKKTDYLGDIFGDNVPSEVMDWYHKFRAGRPGMEKIFKSPEDLAQAIAKQFPGVQLPEQYQNLPAKQPPVAYSRYGAMPAALGGYGRQPLGM